MKKALILALAVTTIGSLAFGQTQVLSRNAVGYVKVGVQSNGLALAALNFNAFDNTISAIFTNQLTGGNNPGVADNIIKWDPISKGYIVFWKTPLGGWRQSGQSVETTNTLKPGESFWIKNNHSSNQTVFLMGEVPDSLTSPTQEVGIVTNISMVSYGYPIEMAITQLNLGKAKGGNNPGLSDNILKWDSSARKYVVFWYTPTGQWRQSGESVATTNKLYPGDGVWYSRRSNDFVWVETKPYTWP